MRAIITSVTWVTEKMACMATIRPQWTATLLAASVWYEPRIKYWVNNLPTVACVLPGTIFLTVLIPTLWAANTAHANIMLSYIA